VFLAPGFSNGLFFEFLPPHRAFPLYFRPRFPRRFEVDLVLQGFQQLYVLNWHHGDDFLAATGERDPLLAERRAINDLRKLRPRVDCIICPISLE
jgi:hypothetical protein